MPGTSLSARDTTVNNIKLLYLGGEGQMNKYINIKYK